MKLRFALLCGFALLLVGGVAAAITPAEAPAAAPAASASAAPAASASPAACGLSLSVVSTSPPSLSPLRLNPAPLLLSATCGTCSKSPCQGASVNQICILQGGREGYGNCISPYGNECSNGQPECQCWSGPLP
jgi:hypothetical protein